MKPHKYRTMRSDNSERPVDSITGTENDFSGKLEEWEDRVFRAATLRGHFTTTRKTTRGQVETHTHRYFSQAAVKAWFEPDMLVYAAAPTGRAVCLIRSRWHYYLGLQKTIVETGE